MSDKAQSSQLIDLSQLGALLEGIDELRSKNKSVLKFTKEKTVPGNKDKTYKFREGEEGHVHVQLWRREFNPGTGKKVHKPFVQIFEPKREWVQFLENRVSQGLEIEKVLHMPGSAMTVEAFDKKAKAKEDAEIKRNLQASLNNR